MEIKAKKAKKPATKKQKALGCLAWVVAIPLVIVACTAGGDDEPKKDKAEVKQEQKADTASATKKDPWTVQLPKLEELAKSDLTPQEKIDKSMAMAKEYKPTEVDLKEFELLVKTSSKKLVAGALQMNEVDPVTTVVMMFKARVLELHNKNTDLGALASDYNQIARDVYRGTETMDSDFVKANIEQLKKNPELNK